MSCCVYISKAKRSCDSLRDFIFTVALGCLKTNKADKESQTLEKIFIIARTNLISKIVVPRGN